MPQLKNENAKKNAPVDSCFILHGIRVRHEKKKERWSISDTKLELVFVKAHDASYHTSSHGLPNLINDFLLWMFGFHLV